MSLGLGWEKSRVGGADVTVYEHVCDISMYSMPLLDYVDYAVGEFARRSQPLANSLGFFVIL